MLRNEAVVKLWTDIKVPTANKLVSNEVQWINKRILITFHLLLGYTYMYFSK